MMEESKVAVVQIMSDGSLFNTEVDDKGRRPVSALSDRELLEEIAQNQRDANDTIQQFIESMAKNPMLKMLAGKFGA